MTDAKAAQEAERFAALALHFEQVRALPDGPALQYIERLRAADAELADELNRLLRSHDTGAPLRDPLPVAAALAEALLEGCDPERVGSYRLVRLLGRGGMGEVHLGERADGQFEQRVAVKLLRAGWFERDMVRRFRAERQILAGLRHANIAALLDGGTTPDGRPFVIMEYVEGQDILQHAAARRLSLTDRLRMFVKVCHAVEHAHRHLVVHRDLKPGNILVGPDGEPKLLDFGIAKLLDAGAPEHGEQTQPGMLWFTPRYASPEQVRGERITTATDVYALGAVLYELLSGRAAQELRDSSPQELLRVVCATERSPLCAGADHPVPARRLRGDLEQICRRALHKEPARRYGDAGELADDLERFMAGLPVTARPDTLRYRAGKFVRRNAWLVGAVTASIVVLSAAVWVTAAQAAQMQIERDEARRGQTVAQSTTDFMVGLFDMAEPDPLRGKELRAVDLLAQGTRSMRALPDQDPLVRARLLAAMGRANLAVGSVDAARSALAEALEIQRQHPERRLELARALLDHGRAMHLGGEHAAAVLALRESQELCAAEAPLWNKVSYHLVDMLEETGALDEAFALGTRVYEQRVAALGPRAQETAESLRQVAMLHRSRHELPRARELLAEAMAIRTEHYGESHPVLGRMEREMGILVGEMGEAAAARDWLRRSIEHCTAVCGADSADVETSRHALARVDMSFGDLDAAERSLRDLSARAEVRYGKGHPLHLAVNGDLAEVLVKRGAFAEAQTLLEHKLEVQRGPPAAAPDMLAKTLFQLSVCQQNQRRWQQAGTLLREAIGLYKAAGHAPMLVTCRGSLAVLAANQGDLATAESEFRELIVLHRARGRPGKLMADTLYNLAAVLQLAEKRDEVPALLDEALSIYREVLPPDRPETMRPLHMQAKVCFRLGDLDGAITRMQEVVRVRRLHLPDDNIDLLLAERDCGIYSLRAGRHDGAETMLLSAAARWQRPGAAPLPDAVVTPLRDALVELFTARQRPAEAERWRTAR